MSSEAQISISNDDGVSDGPLEQDSDEAVRDVKVDLPVPNLAHHVAEQNASDSGVSNASSPTSDSGVVPLNNGDIHGLAKTVFVERVTVNTSEDEECRPSAGEVTTQTSVSSSHSGVSTRRSTEALNTQEQLTSLLEVSGTTYGLSMMSLEVMTSGEQLNLIAEGLGGESEGSVGSRSLSPEPEEGEKRSKESDGDCVSAPVTVIETGSGHTPSESSRCSSSMGCLEPRPHHEEPNVDTSPKVVQKKLLETVRTLTSEEGVREESPPTGDDPPSSATPTDQQGQSPSSSVKHSQSNQSLKSAANDATNRRTSFGSFFKRKKMTYVGSADHTSQTLLAATSTTGLILQDRPSNLPAKSAAEERRHQKLYEQMVAAARKKELERAKRVVKREEERRTKDKMVADSLKEWSKILPKWDSVYKSKKVRDLWWLGLPPGVRGEVWKKALGNDLNISPDLYLINLRRCKDRLQSLDQRGRSDSAASQKSLSREQSVEVIHLDVLRTFPTLGFFQEGGPYHETLRDILGAYACYRPDIGYVQGMSFLAAVLLLNMEAADAFICLANLLNRSSYLAFFRVDHTLMRPYFDSFKIFLHEFLPRLSIHFEQMQFSPEYYLIEWIFTIYTRTLPLDVACRVWDMFCRDGDSFLFRTALGILRLFQPQLLQFQALEDAGQFLGKLPTDISSDTLFGCIDAVHLTPKRFDQVLQSKMTNSTSR